MAYKEFVFTEEDVCKVSIRRLKEYTLAFDKICIVLNVSFATNVVSGYMDDELKTIEKNDMTYFDMDRHGNYMHRITGCPISDDEREGLVSLLMNAFGYLMVDGIKEMPERIEIAYPSRTTLWTAGHIEQRILKQHKTIFRNWKIPVIS